ncbi:MAG: hypothetical protein QXX19_07315, partial [Candidatus Caldarchaeum sp.]
EEEEENEQKGNSLLVSDTESESLGSALSTGWGSHTRACSPTQLSSALSTERKEEAVISSVAIKSV